MGSLGDRLDKLEERRQRAAGTWEIPLYTRVFLTAIARHAALRNGEDPPRYDEEEEVNHLYAEDLRLVEGHRDEPRGADAEGQRRMLEAWRADARRRLEAVELSGDAWREVYQVDEIDDEEEEEYELWTQD